MPISNRIETFKPTTWYKILLGPWVAFGFVLGCSFWLISSLLHLLVFDTDTALNLKQIFFSPDPHELFNRLLVFCLLFGFGLTVQILTTTQRKTLRKLVKREKDYQIFMETTDDLITHVDSQGNLLFVNEASNKIYGLPPQKCLGESAFQFIHDQDKDATQKAFETWLKKHPKHISFENRQVSVDGRTTLTLWTISPVYDQNGNLESMWSIARDITEHKFAKNQLLREKHFSDSLINSLPGVFYLINKDFQFVRWNKSLETLTGYSESEFVNLSPLDLFLPEEKELVAEKIQGVFTTGHASIEASLVSKDGEEIPHFLNGMKTNLDGEDFLIGTGFDISSRKKAEEDRELLLNIMNERIKELRCIYAVASAIQSIDSIPDLLAEVATLIPPGWQHPEKTRGRIIFDEDVYVSPDFEETPWRLSADIIVDDKRRGAVEAVLIENIPDQKGDLFLAEEKQLITNIAGIISEAISSHQSNQLLLESEKKYESVFSSITEGIALHEVVYDEKGEPIDYKILDINPAYEKNTGLKRKDAIGILASKLYGTGTPPYLQEFTSVAKTGKPYFFETYFPPMEKHFKITCVSDEEGKFITVFEDVTLKKQMQLSMEKERKQLLALFDSIEDIIYVADPDSFELLFVNKTFRDAFGEDSVGKKCFKMLQDRDSPCPFCTNDKIFDEHLGKTYVWEFQNEITKHWYRCSDKAIPWIDDRNVRFELAADITDEKILAMEQIRLEKFSALGLVAAGVAHELNNPLMGILNFAQYCMEETKQDDDRYSVLEDIEQETKRCIAIVENLLGASRLDDATMGNVMKFPAKDVIMRVMNLLEYRTMKESVNMTLEVMPNMPNLSMSRDAFQQMILNLLTNAIDAMEESNKKEIKIMLKGTDDDVIIEFSDTGIGISHELRDKIFDPFFTTKAPGKGTGLGLATCWKIVKSVGGDIKCDSKPDYGTTMTVRLPIHPHKGDYQ